MANDSIQALISARIAAIVMSADEVLLRLADQARGSVESFLTIEDGFWKIDITKAKTASALHLIKKLKEGEHGLEIELYDAQAALVHLGKHLGLFSDRQMNLNVDLKGLTNEQLERIAAGEDILLVLASAGQSGAGAPTSADRSQPDSLAAESGAADPGLLQRSG